jgi:hypothetical protein
VPSEVNPNPDDKPNPHLDFTPDKPKPSGMPEGLFNEDPPSIAFKANPTRASANPLSTIGDPAASLANALAMAKDMASLAAQQREAAAAVDNLSEAADKFLTDDHRGSLRASLLSMLVAVVLFNLTADESLGPASMLSAAIGSLGPQGDPKVSAAMSAAAFEARETHVRGEDTYAVGTSYVKQLEYDGDTLALGADFYMDGTVVKFLNDRIPDGATYVAVVRRDNALNEALSAATAAATSVADATSLGAMPGNLVYAAYGDDVPATALASVLATLPAEVALRMGHTTTTSSLIRKITQDLSEPDARLEDIPDLLLGLDPKMPLYRRTLAAYVDFLQWVTLQPNLLKDLRSHESLVSTLSLLLVERVQKTTLALDNLTDQVKDDRLMFDERELFMALVTSWDRAVISVAKTIPNGTPAAVTEFLARLQGVGVPAGSTLASVYTDYRFLLQALSKEAGTDTMYATSVAASLWRAIVLLDSQIDDEAAAKRLKTIFTVGAKFYDKVTHLPNKGCLGRLLEVLP